MIHMLAPKPPLDPREAAVWWATRAHMDPDAHAADVSFVRWREADPANAAAWAEIQEPLAVVSAHAATPQLRAMRDAALEIARARAPTSVRRYWLGGAVVAVSVAAAAFLLVRPVSESPPPGSERFSTQVGERRDIQLDDGSTVALNTASSLDVLYSPERREVRLVAGQALFQVAKDRTRPFVVAAGDRRITATGTAFDVKVDRAGGVRVLLVEGRVNVEPVRPEGLSRLIPSLARDTLNPGQQLSSYADGARAPDIETADVEQGIAWKSGQLIFRQDRLEQAVAEINRYSTTQITLAEPALAGLPISGVFPSARSEDFLAAVQTLYPISVERRTPSIVVLAWSRK